jgi:hypothetical protein
MTHVTTAQSFLPTPHNAALPVERILVLKDLVDEKQAPCPSLFSGVDSELIKTSPGWGEQPGPAGLTTVKGTFGGFVLSPQPKKGSLRADGRQSPQTITTYRRKYF